MLIPQNNKSEHNFWGTYYCRQNKGGGGGGYCTAAMVGKMSSLVRRGIKLEKV